MMQREMVNRATRTIRVSILVCAASVLAVGTLAACSGSSGGGVTNDGGSSGVTNDGGSSGVTNDGGSSGSVTGTVTWPDGHPAANASVYFYNYDPGSAPAAGTTASTRYSSSPWTGPTRCPTVLARI
jgi:hypothetical protein